METGDDGHQTSTGESFLPIKLLALVFQIFNEMLLLNLQSICFFLSDQQVVQDKDSLKLGFHAASTG